MGILLMVDYGTSRLLNDSESSLNIHNLVHNILSYYFLYHYSLFFFI